MSHQNARDLSGIGTKKLLFEPQAEPQVAATSPKIRTSSKTLLSRINKFELLSRGIRTSDESSSDASGLSDLGEPNLVENPVQMLRATFEASSGDAAAVNCRPTSHIQLRDIKSKSFGCEKDLHANDKPRHWSCNNNNNNKAVKSKSKQSKRQKPAEPKPFVIENLNFIDDEEASVSDNQVGRSEADSDENEALIDDLAGENEENDTNPEDEDDEDDYSGRHEYADELKCRSAPITPTRASPNMFMMPHEQRQPSNGNSHNKNNNNSFIYNMDLYNDHNFRLLNEKGKFMQQMIPC